MTLDSGETFTLGLVAFFDIVS